jgi:Protein of unknown function (DUF3617)
MGDHACDVWPNGNQPRTRTKCLTSEALAADPIVALRPEPPAGREAVSCNVLNVKHTPSQISYDTECALPFGVMKTQWQGTLQSGSFATTGQARIMGRALTTQVTGRKLGECPAA